MLVTMSLHPLLQPLMKLMFCGARCAVVDRETAWNQILTLAGAGNGNSKANSLFWVASRPPPRPNYNSSVRPLGPLQSVKPACAANSACDAIGGIGRGGIGIFDIVAIN